MSRTRRAEKTRIKDVRLVCKRDSPFKEDRDYQENYLKKKNRKYKHEKRQGIAGNLIEGIVI